MGMQRTRQRVDTERLLQWAFRDELPKRREDGGFVGPLSPISPLARYVAYGTQIDETAGEPGLPPALGECHPDALIVERAVLSLGHATIDWPATRMTAVGEVGGLLTDTEPTLASLKIGIAGLVAMHAAMRTRPRVLYPAPEPKRGRNGKPEVRNQAGGPVKGRGGENGVPWYPPTAQCPLSWWPEPREAAFTRIEYSIWRQAVDTLADHLRDLLIDYEPLPPKVHPSPWML